MGPGWDNKLKIEDCGNVHPNTIILRRLHRFRVRFNVPFLSFPSLIPGPSDEVSGQLFFSTPSDEVIVGNTPHPPTSRRLYWEGRK